MHNKFAPDNSNKQLFDALLIRNLDLATRLSQLHGIKDYVETTGEYEGVSSLWLALERGPQYSEVAFILDKSGAKDSIPTQGVITGYSVLIQALNTNNFNIALSLIQKGAKDSIIANGNNEGVSALWISVFKGYKCTDVQRTLAYLVATKLISIGARDGAPKNAAFKGTSALSILIIDAQYELANNLVKNGATDSIIEVGMYSGISTLWFALNSNGKCDDIANYLISRGAVDSIGLGDDLAGNSTLFQAINSGNYSIAKILVERGAKDSILEFGPDRGTSTLFLALVHKQFDLAKSLIMRGAKNNVVQSGVNSGMSPLWLALESSEINIEADEIATQLSEDAEDSVLSQRYKGASTLIQAINHNRPDIALKLLSKGAKDSVIAEDGSLDGISALWFAIEREYLDIALKLLDTGAIDYIPTSSEFRGCSVLLLALITANNEKDELKKQHYLTIAKTLIARGAIDSIFVNTGSSSLFLALSMNENKIIDSLLERGAKDTMILTGPLKGETVISLSIEMEKYDVISKLLRHTICGENKDILQALFQFSEKVIKCLLNLQIDGQEDPIFDQLKRYACPISMQLITYPITMSEDGYTYDRYQIQKLINISEDNAISPMSRAILSGEIPKMNRMISDELVALIKKAGWQLSEHFNKIDNSVNHTNDQTDILENKYDDQELVRVAHVHEQYIDPTPWQAQTNAHNNHDFNYGLLILSGIFGVAVIAVNGWSYILPKFTTIVHITKNTIESESVFEVDGEKLLSGYLSWMPAGYDMPSIYCIFKENFAEILPIQDNGSFENAQFVMPILLSMLGSMFIMEKIYRMYNKIPAENELLPDNINEENVKNLNGINPEVSLLQNNEVQDLESQNRILAARREAEKMLDVEINLIGNTKCADANMMEGEEAKNSIRVSYNLG